MNHDFTGRYHESLYFRHESGNLQTRPSSYRGMPVSDKIDWYGVLCTTVCRGDTGSHYLTVRHAAVISISRLEIHNFDHTAVLIVYAVGEL